MKKFQLHFEEVLKKFNLISKKQSHKKITTAAWFGYQRKRSLDTLYWYKVETLSKICNTLYLKYLVLFKNFIFLLGIFLSHLKII